MSRGGRSVGDEGVLNRMGEKGGILVEEVVVMFVVDIVVVVVGSMILDMEVEGGRERGGFD